MSRSRSSQNLLLHSAGAPKNPHAECPIGPIIARRATVPDCEASKLLALAKAP